MQTQSTSLVPTKFDLREEGTIAQIAEVIMTRQTDRVDATVSNYETRDVIFDAIDVLSIVPERLTKRICHKTGRVLSTYTHDELRKMIAVMGDTRTCTTLDRAWSTHTDECWLVTDSQALERLQTYDPLGFSVYCINQLFFFYFKPWRQTYTGFSTKTAPNQLNYRWHDWQAHNAWVAVLAETRAVLETRTVIEIVTLNEQMKTFLRFVNMIHAGTKMHFTTTNPVEAVRNPAQLGQDLILNIISILREERGKGKLKAFLTYDDIINLQLTYGGNSNFRGMNRHKSSELDSHLIAVIHDIQDAFLPSDQKIFETSQTKLRAYIEMEERKKKQARNVHTSEGFFEL